MPTIKQCEVCGVHAALNAGLLLGPDCIVRVCQPCCATLLAYFYLLESLIRRRVSPDAVREQAQVLLSDMGGRMGLQTKTLQEQMATYGVQIAQ